MKIFDGHLHAMNQNKPACDLLAAMGEADISGGCIFSHCPAEYDPQSGTSYEERIAEVKAWTEGYEDRLFPVLWIHPHEKDIIEKVRDAAGRGISAFKMICNNFYVGDEDCLQVCREIAVLNKPIFFHSGILWDGKVSSCYNRPMNWEAILPIEGLRFSLAHCSWPWIDECIALYGKFSHAAHAAQMFLDTTPGTPYIYREELLTKLYKIGYDVSQRVFFGTDSAAHAYDPTYVRSWLELDGSVLDRLEVSSADRENMYRNNLMRFLGKE